MNRLFDVLKALFAGLIAVLTLRRLPMIATGLSTCWVMKRIRPEDPYVSVIVGFTLAILVSWLLGTAAEIVLVLTALALAEALGVWTVNVRRHLLDSHESNPCLSQ